MSSSTLDEQLTESHTVPEHKKPPAAAHGHGPRPAGRRLRRRHTRPMEPVLSKRSSSSARRSRRPRRRARHIDRSSPGRAAPRRAAPQGCRRPRRRGARCASASAPNSSAVRRLSDAQRGGGAAEVGASNLFSRSLASCDGTGGGGGGAAASTPPRRRRAAVGTARTGRPPPRRRRLSSSCKRCSAPAVLARVIDLFRAMDEDHSGFIDKGNSTARCAGPAGGAVADLRPPHPVTTPEVRRLPVVPERTTPCPMPWSPPYHRCCHP